MLVFRYIFKETLKAQIAVFLVLMSIFVTRRFVQVLADASEGGMPADLVAGFLLLKIPHLAGLILPLSFFLGILLAHGRMYSDSEMTVLHACGISEWYVTRIVLILSIVLSILTASLTMWLAPWAKEQEYQLKEAAQADVGLDSIVPGRFEQTADGKAVMFVHELTKGNDNLSRVFVAQVPESRQSDDSASVVYAKKGKVLETEDGSQELQLIDGKRWDGKLDQAAFQQVDFQSYEVQIKEQEVDRERRKLSAFPLQQLFNDPGLDAYAEVQWRIAIPLSLPLLTLIAVPLAAVNPRQGKYGRLMPAILLYLGYYLLLMAGRNALEDGNTPKFLGLWWIHLAVFIMGTTMLLKGRGVGTRIRSLFLGGHK